MAARRRFARARLALPAVYGGRHEELHCAIRFVLSRGVGSALSARRGRTMSASLKLISPRARIDRRLVAAVGALALCVGVPLRAQSAECTSSFAASSKLYDKPFHAYTIDSAQTDARLHGGQPMISESIWTGTVDYILVRGKWMTSPLDLAEMRKTLKDASTKVKATCSHVRDESVNGEPAAVWRIHSVSELDTSDTDEWISRSSGLLLKSDVHQDVGGALGKSHIVSRYEYTNVRPPAGAR